MKLSEFYKDRNYITNIDLDGFISTAILTRIFGGKTFGFTNSHDKVYYYKNASVRSKDCVWVDFHCNLPNHLCHDQHVNIYRDAPCDNEQYSLNPNNDRGITFCQNYTRKFPFSTSMDLLFRMDEEGIRVDVDFNKVIDEQRGITILDLIWYTDSSICNLRPYGKNCFDWLDYERERTNNGYYMNILYDYIKNGDSRAPLIKDYLEKTFKTNNKSKDGYRTDDDFNANVKKFITSIYEMFGVTFDYDFSDFMVKHMTYGCENIDTNVNFDDFLASTSGDNTIFSFSFIYGPSKNNDKKQFSYTLL